MKIESTSLGADALTKYMDQLVDHDRLQMAAPARVPVSPPSEGGGWTGQEILAHLDQLEQALGDR
jgi:hypothetical protein